jgi:hypothetical protein
MDLVEASGNNLVRHPWETARLRVVERLISQHGQPPAGSTIVDLGCGDAFVARALAKKYPSCAVIGIDRGFTADDLSRFDRNGAPGRLTLVRTVSDAVRQLRRDSQASLILMMDVLEHVEDTQAFLEEVTESQLCGPATCLVVTVPAYQFLWTTHDVFLRHFRRYTRVGLNSCLADAGLHVDRSGYFFASLLPVRIVKVLYERLTKNDRAVESDLRPVSGGPLGAALVSWLLSVDAFVLLALRRVGLSIPGLSVYAICRKSA